MINIVGCKVAAVLAKVVLWVVLLQVVPSHTELRCDLNTCVHCDLLISNLCICTFESTPESETLHVGSRTKPALCAIGMNSTHNSAIMFTSLLYLQHISENSCKLLIFRLFCRNATVAEHTKPSNTSSGP